MFNNRNTCIQCGADIEFEYSGRPKLYCGNRCRKAAQRHREGVLPRRKENNQLKTTVLEQYIIRADLNGQQETANTLRQLARQISAPIDERLIAKAVVNQQLSFEFAE